MNAKLKTFDRYDNSAPAQPRWQDRPRAGIKHGTYVNEDTGRASVLMLESHAAIDSLYDQMRAPQNPRRQAELDRQRAGLHARMRALNAVAPPNR